MSTPVPGIRPSTAISTRETVSGDAPDSVEFLTPVTVVLSKRLDGEWDAKICDLGIARDEIKERMTRGKFRGSDHYQPPVRKQC